MIRPYRLALWITHPIQYQAPLFRKLAQHPQIYLRAYYGSEHGSVDRMDLEFGVSFQWDTPLLEGYDYRFLPNRSWKRQPVGFWWVFNPGIVAELFRNKYDAIIVHGYASASSWLALLGAWLSRTPVLFRGETVLREQAWWKKFLKQIGLRFLFRRTAGCLAVGRKSVDFYRTYGVPREKIFLTPYCVDNDFFISGGKYWAAKRKEIRHELGFPEELPVILYSGKLIARKRPLDLIEAAARIPVPAGLLFVGDGPLRPALEEQARRRGLKWARFVGFQNQSALARYYAAADIFVFPSAFETYGLALNEALCMGLPVLSTSAVAAAADLVREGENGFLFSVGDIETLARRLGQLCADPELRRTMRRRSREIIAGWNYDVCVAGVLKALEAAQRGREDAQPGESVWRAQGNNPYSRED